MLVLGQGVASSSQRTQLVFFFILLSVHNFVSAFYTGLGENTVAAVSAPIQRLRSSAWCTTACCLFLLSFCCMSKHVLFALLHRPWGRTWWQQCLRQASNSILQLGALQPAFLFFFFLLCVQQFVCLTAQAMGENTMAAMLALSQRLASGPAPSFTPSKAKSVFFDVAGYFMVSASDCNGVHIYSHTCIVDMRTRMVTIMQCM